MLLACFAVGALGLGRALLRLVVEAWGKSPRYLTGKDLMLKSCENKDMTALLKDNAINRATWNKLVGIMASFAALFTLVDEVARQKADATL